MPSEWFYQKNGVWRGPFTAKNLRALADVGVIHNDSPVRKGTDGKPVQAFEVKGLFDDPEPDSPLKAKSNDSRGITESFSKKVRSFIARQLNTQEEYAFGELAVVVLDASIWVVAVLATLAIRAIAPYWVIW